jgi:dTMP kinase
MIVITDRYSDSTLAYQGYARGVDSSLIMTLDEIVSSNLKPFVTFLLDLEVEDGLERNRKAKKEDRFELETVDFHKRVRNGYLQIARDEPERVKVIPASDSSEAVHKRIVKTLEDLWQ